MQAAQVDAVRLGSRRRRARRDAGDGEQREGTRDIAHQPRPIRVRRSAQQLRGRGELRVAAVERRIRLVRPVDQKTCRDDQMQRDDRGDDERGDLAADAAEVEETEKLHDAHFMADNFWRQLPAAKIASTLSVNM